jgi:hypothetical protein
MGTLQRWLNVALSGAFWAGCMLLFDLIGNCRAGQYSVPRILSTILSGFCFGLMLTFGWDAVRAPLIYLVMPASIAFALAGLFYRRATRNQGNPSSSPG